MTSFSGWGAAWGGSWGPVGPVSTAGAYRGLLAFWAGGARAPAVATGQAGLRGLLAFWAGGAATAVAPVAATALRSLLAFWVGGAAGVAPTDQPRPQSPAPGQRRITARRSARLDDLEERVRAHWELWEALQDKAKAAATGPDALSRSEFDRAKVAAAPAPASAAVVAPSAPRFDDAPIVAALLLQLESGEMRVTVMPSAQPHLTDDDLAAIAAALASDPSVAT